MDGVLNIMHNILIAFGTAFPIVITVILTSIRLESRLTKVETNLVWIMQAINKPGCENVNCNEKESVK